MAITTIDILINISLAKTEETLNYLQNRHVVTDPCSEEAFPGQVQAPRFSAKILQNGCCKDFSGKFQEHRFSVKILQNGFCKDFTGEF